MHLENDVTSGKLAYQALQKLTLQRGPGAQASFDVKSLLTRTEALLGSKGIYVSLDNFID